MYWRRRALVAGTVAVVVLAVAYSCSGGDEKDGRQGATGNKTSASADPNGQTQGPPGPPAVVPSAGEATGGPPVAGGGNGGNASASNRPAGAGDLCSDAEVQVTASVDKPSVRQGEHAQLTLRVKNISGRTCSRDVGADMTELWIADSNDDTKKQWSSDLCENRTGEGMTSFASGHELPFTVDWNGKITSQGCDNRPYLSPGTYQVYARVGTKRSNPTTLTVTT
ncbi:hypothetical protein Val02_81330 [Virgisporangium aliadipatigenens]|uniref:DUF4232 domain-containing protein n=1 Tax=Virgisporangium aliadipatigenens TaxID=741659 RepID=A0A8J3YVH0_9ACTN|nr:hypothetical protein Val02_81330 [Virgisporangium aliadipatigenens]